jgi:hypothetical protein
MGHKKRFSAPNTTGSMSPISGANSNGGSWNDGRSSNMGTNEFAFKNYQSKLPEVYTGHPNRVERYNQFDTMDMDPEVNACLDIISEFSTQKNEQNNTPFEIEWSEDPTPNEVELVKKQLQQWCKLNQFDVRVFKLFRNTLKYGDQIFVRDPNNFKLYWVDMTKVVKVIVNEAEGKDPEQYVIKDINPNLQNLSVAQKTSTDFQPSTSAGGYSTPHQYSVPNGDTASTNSRFKLAMNESAIDAKHVCHLSLTEGLDRFWPFGQSILETIFKVYKQKELLEDAILIYRVQRAPERRVFKIDVGNMPSHMAMAFVDRVKNEIHQRRIPSAQGGQAMLDATYSPLSINEDYFFPVTADGRGSDVTTLPGGDNLGQIDDLKYFNNRMARGLRVPSSYLPTGPDDNQTPLSDGRVGTAMIQEFRFNQYCERLQNYISQKLDDEFKMFLRFRGFNIDSSLFTLKFNAPQNFAAYRQSELDKDRVGTFGSIEAFPYISKRFALERFLGLSKEEIAENEKLWHEEQDEPGEYDAKGSDLRSIGISGGDLSSDLESAEALGDGAGLEGMGPEGDAGAPMGDMGAPDLSGMPPPPM